jgi:hypothetical protein
MQGNNTTAPRLPTLGRHTGKTGQNMRILKEFKRWECPNVRHNRFYQSCYRITRG